MNITSAQNPIYANVDNTEINCTITCEKGVFPFTATPHDPMPYGLQLYNDLIAGKYGAIAAYVAP